METTQHPETAQNGAQVEIASLIEAAFERALNKHISRTAGGFLSPIKFKRPNPSTGVQEEITTCVAQQLENLCIVVSALVRTDAELIAEKRNLIQAIGELIRAVDENTDASDTGEEEAEPAPRRRRKG